MHILIVVVDKAERFFHFAGNKKNKIIHVIFSLQKKKNINRLKVLYLLMLQKNALFDLNIFYVQFYFSVFKTRDIFFYMNWFFLLRK